MRCNLPGFFPRALDLSTEFYTETEQFVKRAEKQTQHM